MGVKRLAENAAALIDGRPRPRRARRRDRTRHHGRPAHGLGDAGDDRRGGRARAGQGAPALIVVGPVAARREQLAWLERRPLHGRRVVVTRARAQASGLAATLRELGAEVVELPAIRIEPRIDTDEVRDAAASIGEYALVCLTSPNGVRLLFEALADGGLDARALAGATVAAIGPGTARALRERGIVADVVPERFVAEALVEALADVEVEGRRVLVARAAEARDVLPDALRERGAEVDVVALYETVREEPSAEAVEAAQSGRLRHLHLLLDRHQPDRRARRPLPRCRPRRLDRPGHQRGRPRRRPRGRRRSRAPRHRRPPRRPPRRRRAQSLSPG